MEYFNILVNRCSGVLVLETRFSHFSPNHCSNSQKSNFQSDLHNGWDMKEGSIHVQILTDSWKSVNILEQSRGSEQAPAFKLILQLINLHETVKMSQITTDQLRDIYLSSFSCWSNQVSNILFFITPRLLMPLSLKGNVV